ncbi:MAG TPA: iron-containing redox enzyme family protein [Acidimicrobiales bacterium]|nr:iron-containing redox enzyme family protein [Acidimicrobiales bacterium]
MASLKQRAEGNLLASLAGATPHGEWGDDVCREVRRIATRGRIAPIYRWIASDATAEELVEFIAVEGGPDDGFDDLVACCQVGLTGEPKMEMATNYWDEMGRGDARQVHRALHRNLSAAMEVPHIARGDLPLPALRRSLLTTTLATNRSMQPELVGVLGMIEMCAGPRCRKVVAGLERVGASADALPFYEVHAVTDPRHGKDWLDHVIAPLSHDPGIADGIVRGARWRAEVDRAFFTDLWDRFVDVPEPQAA